jgi:hypothetical protein
MGIIFSFFIGAVDKRKKEKENRRKKEKEIRILLREDESFREYLRVYSGELSINNSKLEFEEGLIFK